MGLEVINKFYYWIFNKSYYEVVLRENGNKIGILVQQEPNKIKGGDYFLVSKSLKRAWLKPISNKKETGEILYTDGKKFVCIADMENSIICSEEKRSIIKAEKLTIKNEEFIKFTEIIEPVIDDNKKEIKITNYSTGRTITLSQDMPVAPALLFELLEGVFVTQTAAVPKSKWEELKWVFIVLILVSGFVIWQLITSGALTSL